MSFRDRYQKKKALLTRQHTTQIQNKDLRGNYPTIVDKSKLPAGIEMWKCDSSDHIIDILPSFAGPDYPNDPVTRSKIINEGDPVYTIDLTAHKNIGPNKQIFVCPNENYGLPCPICEYMDNNRLEKEDWKNIKAKRVTIYLIWVHDTRETEKKGIYVWEVAHFIMEEKLNVISKLPKGGGAIKFSDPDEGKSIAFTKDGKGDKVQYLGHRFIDREMAIPEKLLDMTFPLDSVCTLHPSYEEIEKAFHGQKSKLSKDGDVDKAGSAFKENDEVPDWMSENPPPLTKDAPKTVLKGKTTVPAKRKLVLKRK